LIVHKSRPPLGPQAVRDGIRFWLDGSVWEALNVLMVEGKYEETILDFDDNGFVFIEEARRSSKQLMLADHVASLSRYTEKDCRRICLEIAHIIKLSHDNGMAHRNLHLNNFVVGQNVSLQNVIGSRVGAHDICSRISFLPLFRETCW
jgi:serine/threonine protein kinase